MRQKMLNLQKIIIVHLAEFNCAVILKEIRNGLPIIFFLTVKDSYLRVGPLR